MSAGNWQQRLTVRASVKPSLVYSATDEFGFKVVEKQVSIHDLHATVLHLLGLDREKLTY